MSAELMYDRADALMRLGGDEELLSNVSQLFVAESDLYCQALHRAMTDAQSLRREAHTVKSMFATFSCEAGRAQAAQLEQLAASGQMAGAAQRVAALVATIRQFSAVLDNETASS